MKDGSDNSLNPQTTTDFSDFNFLADAFANFDGNNNIKSPDILFVDSINLQEVVDKDSTTPSPNLLSTNLLDPSSDNEVSSEDLASLLEKLQLPASATPTTNDFRLPSFADTRLTTEFTTAITTLLTNLNMAFTTFLTDVQAAVTANPLLGVILALGALALAYHHFPYKFRINAVHKGSHHGGGHSSGYHRQDYDVEEEYRTFDQTNQILNQISSFEKWLQKEH